MIPKKKKTPQEMKKILKDRYDSGMQGKRIKYHQKIDGMVNCQVEQEYNIVILGKEYVAPVKKAKFSKKAETKLNKKELKEVEMHASKEDIKGMW